MMPLSRTNLISVEFDPYWWHSGIKTTTKKVLAYFYWKGVRKDTNIFVHKCVVCQRNKYDTSASPGLLQPLPILVFLWINICMNFIEGLPNSKGKFVIWIIVD